MSRDIWIQLKTLHLIQNLSKASVYKRKIKIRLTMPKMWNCSRVKA